MNYNIIRNNNTYIILLLTVSLSVVIGLLITSKLILGNRLPKDLDEKDYSSYFNDKYRWHKDTKTKNIVNNLHPLFRGKIAEFFSEIENKLGLTAYATSGYRDFKHQTRLYNQNNQNAKAGYSSHNYGFAIDINVKDKNGKRFLKKADTSKKWRDSGVVPLSEKLNLKWGGDGNFGNYHDPVHFYIRPKNKSTTELLALVKDKQVDAKGYVIV